MFRNLCLWLIALSSSCIAQNYQFYGTMNRVMLESYLSRTMVAEFNNFHRGMKPYYDLIDFTARSNARMLNITYAVGYGSELPLKYGFFDSVRNTITDINNAYRYKGLEKPIVGAAIWEKVTSSVDSLVMSDEVANTFHVTKRRFIFDSIKYITDTNTGIASPDISRQETQMYFYYLATQFIDCGIEMLHMGIIEMQDINDPGHIHTWELLSRIRKYASTKNRGLVLINADNFGLYLKNTDTLLYDYNTSPSRVSGYYSGEDSTWHSMWNYVESENGGPGVLSYTECSPYGKMRGGVSPLGWRADTIPYLVNLDNTLTNNCNCLRLGGCWNVYGYDEISWFVLQSESYRNQWLCYAYSEVKKLDRNAHFIMPGRTLFTHNWSFYMSVNGYGYNQEDAILNIWNGTMNDCDPNKAPNFKALWENDNPVSVLVYPNPISAESNIIYNAAEGERVTLKIIDVLGHTVNQWETGSYRGHQQLDMKSMPPGIYFCTASVGHGPIGKFKIVVLK